MAVAEKERIDPDELDGNIYKFFALCEFGNKKLYTEKQHELSLFTPPDDIFSKVCLYVGLLSVIAVQVIAPLSLFGSNIFKLVGNIDFGAWRSYDITQWFVVMLAWSFLFSFILYCYNSISSDIDSMRKVCRLAEGLATYGRTVRKPVLVMDAVINCYVAICLCIAMFTVLYNEENAQGVVMDALALTFILSIDDIASDLGFLGGVWDPAKVGRFYDKLDKLRVLPPDPDDPDADAAIDPTTVEDGEAGSVRTVASAAAPAPANSPGAAPLTPGAGGAYYRQETNRMMQHGTHIFADGAHLMTDQASFLKGEFGKGAMEAANLIKMPMRVYKCTKCCLLFLLMMALPTPFFLTSAAKKDDDLAYLIDTILHPSSWSESTQNITDTLADSRRLFREVIEGEDVTGQKLYVAVEM